MPAYRIYYGDLSGKVFTAHDLEVADDRQAIDDAKSKGWSAAYEVWERRRLVHRHPPDVRLSGGKPPQLGRLPADLDTARLAWCRCPRLCVERSAPRAACLRHSHYHARLAALGDKRGEIDIETAALGRTVALAEMRASGPFPSIW
jgi:hypothetical protein